LKEIRPHLEGIATATPPLGFTSFCEGNQTSFRRDCDFVRLANSTYPPFEGNQTSFRRDCDHPYLDGFNNNFVKEIRPHLEGIATKYFDNFSQGWGRKSDLI